MLLKSTIQISKHSKPNLFPNSEEIPRGEMTHGSPLGKHDRMRQGYFKTRAMSSILRSSVIRFGRELGLYREQSTEQHH